MKRYIVSFLCVLLFVGWHELAASRAILRNTEPAGFAWEAQVAPDGQVTGESPKLPTTPTAVATATLPPPLAETPEPGTELVTGWRGTLHSLPDDAAYDDYFRVLGGEGGQYGIAGREASIETELASLRGSPRIVTIWGVLLRDVADYGDRRIIVDRFELVSAPPTSAPPTSAPASELVEGWTGVIRALPAGSSADDFFDAQQPGGQYGLGAVMPRLQEEIVAYREAGTPVRIWGMLDHGVSDYGGTRIVVTRIEPIGP